MDTRPRNHLTAAARLYPHVWRLAEKIRSDRGKNGLPEWPPWCYLPMAGWYSIVSAYAQKDKLPLEMVWDVARLAALGTWRVTQGIYRYDPTLYEAVRSTAVTGDLPCEILYHLPEWCVYIETPDLWDGSLHGYFAHLEWDANTGRHELRFLLDCDTVLAPLPIHLGPWPLDEAIRRANAEIVAQGGPADLLSAFRDIEPMVSLLLYICTEAADFGPGPRPRRPKPTKTEKGLRLFPPDHPRLWDVGIRFGTALRREYTAESIDWVPGDEQQRSRPRPHIRRAHWHTYRVDAGRTGSRLKWLPPIPVNVELPPDLPTVVHPIKANN